MPTPDLSTIDREALALAAKKCVGHYTIEHIVALRSLKKRGLVKAMRTADDMGRYFGLTERGREVLDGLEVPAVINRLVILTDSCTSRQSDAITTHLQSKGWHVWHWFKDSWLLSGVPEEVTPGLLWNEIVELPGILLIHGVVFRVGEDPDYYGFGPAKSWEWMALHWGELDEVKEIADAD